MRWLAQGFSWGANLYAARLLAPSDYGLIAMAMIAIGLARMIEDFGLDAILVQDRSIEGDALRQIAGFVIGIAVVLMGLYATIAGPVADFFGEEVVRVLIIGLAPLFFTDALQVISRALLQRRLDYRRLAILHLVQTIASGVTLIAAVAFGLGYWSLVLNHLGGAIAATVLAYAWAPYGIALPREIRRLAHPLIQGWRVLVSRAVYYAYSSADQTIIGRLLHKDALGAYSFAMTFSTFVSQEITGVVSKVVPGIFSEVQRDTPSLRRYFLLLTGLLATLTFPVLMGTALIADVFIPVVLGPQWEAVIAPLRLLCFYAAYTASQLLLAHVMMWTGQFRAQMWVSVVPAVVMPGALWVAASTFGLPGVAWAWLLIYPIANLPPFFIAFRTINVNVVDWLRAMRPALASSTLMAAGVIGVRITLGASTTKEIELALSVAIGALVYFAAMWFLFRAHVMALFDLVRQIRQPASKA